MGTIQDFGAVLKKLRQVGFQDIVLVGGREVVGPRLLGGNIEGDFIAEETWRLAVNMIVTKRACCISTHGSRCAICTPPGHHSYR